MKKTVRTNKGGWFSVAITLILFGGMFLFANKENIKSAFTGAYDIYDEDVNASDIKIGDGIRTDIYAALDNFGTLETTTKNSKTGNVTGKTYHYYYIIPVFEGEETRYMAVKVSSGDRKAFDKIVDDTWDYLAGDADYFTDNEFAAEGNIQKLDGQAYEYFVEWFEEAEWFDTTDRDEIEEYLVPICLELKELRSTSIMVYVSMGIIALGILIIVIHFVRKSNNKKKEAAEQAAYNNGFSAAQNGEAAGNNAATAGNTADTANHASAGTYTETASYGNGTEYTVIGGAKLPKADMDRINGYVAAGDSVTAIRELRDMTGLGIAEAKDIIDNWGSYYR